MNLEEKQWDFRKSSGNTVCLLFQLSAFFAPEKKLLKNLKVKSGLLPTCF